jgi:hypothetical protein
MSTLPRPCRVVFMWLEELDKIKSITATEDEEEKSRLLKRPIDQQFYFVCKRL